MRFAALIVAALSLAVACYAQNTPNRQAGVYIAAAYNYDIDSSFYGGFGPYTFPDTACKNAVSLGARAFDPFNVNASVLVTDSAPGNTETVAFISQNLSAGQCVLHLAVTNPHVSYHLSSGTYGLQEAINDAVQLGGGNIVVDSKWHGITAMITGAAGSSIVSITDNRTGSVFYSWNGSNYVIGSGVAVTSVSQTSGGGVSVTGGQFTPSVGLITTCSTNQVLAWSGTAWVCNAPGGGAPGSPSLSIQGNCGGALCGLPGTTINSSTGQVNVLPLYAGGTSVAPSWDIGTIAATNLASAFAFVQSPSSPSSISAGSVTVTINAVRGINVFSAPPGITGLYTKHYLWLAGTGTAEAVLLTATNCTGASTGTCTVTFTAANSHSAGYTLGSANGGYQEAYDDAWIAARAQTLLAPGGSLLMGIKVYGRANDSPVFNAPFNIDGVNGSSAPIVIDFGGSSIACNTSGMDCVLAGTHVGANTLGPQDAVIENGMFIIASNSFVRTANGTSIAVHDAGQDVKLWNLKFTTWSGQNSTAVFDYLISIDGDQHPDIAWINTHVGNNPPLLCDTTFCGAAILGATTSSAANGTIHDSELTMGCKGAAFDWQSGNGLSIYNNIFQNWPIFPWRYGPGLVDITDLGHNYYEGACTNPELGYAAGTGPQYFGNHVLIENNWSPGFGAAVAFTQFSNTGSTIYTYYIVGINGSGFQTVPLMLGTAATNGSTNYTMKWPDFGATSYTVLRDGPLALDGTDTAPYGTGNWQVASGITCSGTPHICSFTETFGSTSSITLGGSQWVPTIGTADQTLRYWPVPVFLGTQTANGCVLYVGIALSPVNDCLFSGGGTYYTAIYTGPGVSGGNNISINGAQSMTGVRAWKGYSMQSSSATGKASTGAMIIPAAQNGQLLTGFKGPINFSTSWNLSSHDSDLLTFYDDAFAKTLNAGPSHQPTNDPGDSAIGITTSPKYLGIRANTEIDWYLNHKFDSGTSAIERLTSTTHIFTLPLAAAGTAAGLTGTGACLTLSSQLGGSWSGSVTCTGTTGASTLVITPGGTATNDWNCSGSDTTSGHELAGAQSGLSATTCTLKFASVTANDVLSFTANRF